MQSLGSAKGMAIERGCGRNTEATVDSLDIASRTRNAWSKLQWLAVGLPAFVRESTLHDCKLNEYPTK